MRLTTLAGVDVTLRLFMIVTGVLLAALLLFGFVQTVRIDGMRLSLPLIGSVGPEGWKPRALKAEAGIRLEVAAHRQTKTVYREAQAEAARQQIIRIAMHQKEVEQINDRHRAALNRNLADQRARFERLLAKAGANSKGATYAVRVPVDPNAAARTDGGAGDAGLPPAREPIDQLERDWIATKQAYQLQALIGWVRDQVSAGEALNEPAQ
jgi:hypothetical protein